MAPPADLGHCPECGQGRFTDEDWCGCGTARPDGGWLAGAGPWPEITPPPAVPTRILHQGSNVLASVACSLPPRPSPGGRAESGGRSPASDAVPGGSPDPDTANSVIAEIDFSRRRSLSDLRGGLRATRRGLALSAAIALVAVSAYLIGRWDAGRQSPSADRVEPAWSWSR